MHTCGMHGSVAMALAESSLHAAPRGQNMARAGEEVHEKKHNAPWRQKPPLSSVPVLTPGRELETTRSTPPSSSSHRSTFPNASRSSPSIHPFRKLWKDRGI